MKQNTGQSNRPIALSTQLFPGHIIPMKNTEAETVSKTSKLKRLRSQRYWHSTVNLYKNTTAVQSRKDIFRLSECKRELLSKPKES
jgi:hypothetical protein